MEVKELPGCVPGERVRTLHVVCEGTSYAVIPSGDTDTETFFNSCRDCCLMLG